MSYAPPGKKKDKSPLARVHSPAVMLLLVLLLVIYLVYVLAEKFGIEGEGGWLTEVLGSAIFIAGIILLAALFGGVFLVVRTMLQRRRGRPPWADGDGAQKVDRGAGSKHSTGRPNRE